MLLLLISSAWASSLDNLEVGGPWGTPTASDATALWWNPAGMAMGSGTRVMFDLERAVATVNYDRVDPYNGGLDVYETFGNIPFGGVVTDFGVEGLGVGFGVAVPIARGGEEKVAGGTGASHMIMGATQQPNAMVAAAYSPHPAISLGVTGMVVKGVWEGITSFQNVTDLDANISALGQESGYTDEMIEDPAYAAIVKYDPLEATAFRAALGLASRPVEELELGASWVFGTTLTHSGGVTLYFSCPPQSDTLGRFGAEAYGICDETIKASSTVTFNIPHRLRLGAAYTFADTVRAELMGGWTGWATHDGFDIVMKDTAKLNELSNEETSALIEKDRSWARDNQNATWFALDTKTYVKERWTFGARVLHDRAAVPDSTLSPNNYDANTTTVTGLVAVHILDQLEIGLRGTKYFVATRVVTDSAYAVTLDEANAVDPEYFYPQMNGTYDSDITRFGLTVRGHFGGKNQEE